MVKKLSSIRSVSLTYYIGANLIALTPAIVAVAIVSKFATTPWQYLIYNAILFVPIICFSLKWSSRNINKGYIVLNKKSVTYWSIGFLLFFNISFLMIIFAQIGYISVSMLSSVVNMLIGAILIYVLTPKLIVESSKEDIEAAQAITSSEPAASIAKQVFRTALLTFGGFILLLIMPFIGYFLLISVLSWKGALIVIGLYILFVIFLAKRYVFTRKNKN
jgi:hypothetical protein